MSLCTVIVCVLLQWFIVFLQADAKEVLWFFVTVKKSGFIHEGNGTTYSWCLSRVPAPTIFLFVNTSWRVDNSKHIIFVVCVVCCLGRNLFFVTVAAYVMTIRFDFFSFLFQKKNSTFFSSWECRSTVPGRWADPHHTSLVCCSWLMLAFFFFYFSQVSATVDLFAKSTADHRLLLFPVPLFVFSRPFCFLVTFLSPQNLYWLCARLFR